MTTAAEAIEAVKPTMQAIVGGLKEAVARNTPRIQMPREMVIAILDRMAELERGWVSVKEQLPARNTEVLIAFRDSTLPATGQYTGSVHDHEGWCFPAENDPDETGPVAFWRPLPSAPDAKEQA